MQKNWRLTRYKRIIREIIRCKEDFLIQQNRSCKLLVTEKADIQILNSLKEIKI